jgi:hypothetical protein
VARHITYDIAGAQREFQRRRLEKMVRMLEQRIEEAQPRKPGDYPLAAIGDLRWRHRRASEELERLKCDQARALSDSCRQR